MNENAVNTFDAEDIAKNKTISGLSYLGGGLLFFLPLVSCKDSKFGRFHANQALVLFICSIGAGIVGGILSAMIPVLGSLISGLISLASFVLMIIGIVGGVQGKSNPLPIIGNLFTILK